MITSVVWVADCSRNNDYRDATAPTPDVVEDADLMGEPDVVEDADVMGEPDVVGEADMSVDGESCVPAPHRWIDTGPYYTGVYPVAEVISDAEQFEASWHERVPGFDAGPPTPAPPTIDFDVERVAWHTFHWRNTTLAIEPLVLSCSDRVVVEPRFIDTHGEFPSVVFTLVTLPRNGFPVEFADPVEVR
jgi:hypothetical protein